MAARYQNVPEFAGFQKWMTKRPGGGYPSKVDAMVEKFAAEKGFTIPPYLQHTGGDESVLDLAIRTGRMPAITYAGRDDFYRGTIAHMVDCAHLDATDGAIIDNNRPGKWVWMTRAELLDRWRKNGGGWAFVFLAPPPPPAAVEPKSFGQCPNGRCPLQPTNEYLWEGPHGGDKPFWFLVLNGVHVGILDDEGYKPAIGDNAFAGEATGDPPVAPPATGRFKVLETNYGIDRLQVHQDKRYSVNGVDVDREAAMAAMLTDDSGRMHLTIVSDDDVARRAAIQAIATVAGRDRVHVQGYRSTDWPVAARGLKPGVTLQKPLTTGGMLVWHSNDVTAAAAGEAITRSDPNWTPPAPPAPPAPVNPIPQPMPGPGPVVPARIPAAYLVALALGAIAAVMYFRTNRSPNGPLANPAAA